LSIPKRVYFDNAATSWPKPEAVYSAVEQAMRHLGASAGRSPYGEATEATRRVEATRAACARLLGIRNPAQLVFTSGGTSALNLAIHGILQPGDHVITTALEHNSVLRPLTDWRDRGEITLTHVACDAEGRIDPGDVQRAIGPRTRLIALTHASNVTGAIQPVAEVCALARQAGVTTLIDAAQTAGHLPIDVEQLDVDMLATSGHKGLLGPLGTGLLYIRPGLEPMLRPIQHGGTGTRSDLDRQPTTMPDKYESGNLNVPAILGLAAAAIHLAGRPLDAWQQRAKTHLTRLRDGLAELRGVRLFGPRSAADSVALVSLTIEGYDPQEVAAVLDASFRIQVRPGLHCAPLVHRALGTLERGGTVRLSPGHFTTTEEIDAVVAAVASLAST
jgi:cysteine desulfurase / selenocysteine lyase